MSQDEREPLQSRHDVPARQPAQAAQDAVAPGKQPRTTRLAAPAAGAPAPVQRKGAAVMDAAARAEQAAMTEQWLDTAVRPDLHPPPVQRKGAGEGQAGEAASTAAAGSGQGLPGPVQAKMEQAFGADFSAVKVHEGPQAAAVGAQAYTQGTDIHFAPGRYDPGSQSGQELLGHELTHVVQQRQGRVQATTQHKDVAINADGGLEREADVMGARAARGERADVGPSGAAHGQGGAVQRAVIQRVTASDYKGDVDLLGMSLSQLDRYANRQADWASSPNLSPAVRDQVRALLRLARGGDGVVIDGSGSFTVQDLVNNNVGQGGGGDANMLCYSQAASINRSKPTVNIESPAANVAEALTWGDALGKLEAGVGGLIIEQVIKQNGTYENLKDLVAQGAVDDFIQYYTVVQPNLDARNGREIVSYLAFRAEGCDPAAYKAALPEVRNLHRFTKTALDGIITNKSAPKGDLPLTIVLQSNLDHNGAFHRDPFLDAVITRANNVTLVVEGGATLAAFSSQLAPLAQRYKNDGKVDQVMINGHGNAQMMELGGANAVGQNSAGDQIYGKLSNEPLTVHPAHPAQKHQDTEQLIDAILDLMENDPDTRIVLNACLTASNSVSAPLRSDTPGHTQEDIRNAIAANPSLATAVAMRAQARGKGQVDVRGANASFGQVGLLDGSDKIDIVSARDPKLTSPKEEYAREGEEPTGVLRALVEVWGTDRTKAAQAVQWRLANHAGGQWNHVVVRSLYEVIDNHPDDGVLINTLVGTAGALGHLLSRSECGVGKLDGKVPLAHMDDIFSTLETFGLWAHADLFYLRAVVYQVWMAQSGGKKASFLATLGGAGLTTRDAAGFVDLAYVTPLLDNALLPTPAPSPAPRGPMLLALLFMVRQRAGAPAACKAFLQSVAVGNDFPANANVGSILAGATVQSVLENAGIVPASGAVAPVHGAPVGGAAPETNLAPTGSQFNSLVVESVTLRGTLRGQADALDKPGGDAVGSIASGTRLHVIGKARGTKWGFFFDTPNTEYLAVEHTIKQYHTVFIEAAQMDLEA